MSTAWSGCGSAMRADTGCSSSAAGWRSSSSRSSDRARWPRRPDAGRASPSHHRRVRRHARCVRPGARPRLSGRLLEDLQGTVQVADQSRALRAWNVADEEGARRRPRRPSTLCCRVVPQRRGPDDPGRDCAATGPGPGLAARHRPRRTQRPPLRQRHARAPAFGAAGFLTAHPDLYQRSHGAVRLRIEGGRIAIGSLHEAAGFASAALPDVQSMRRMAMP